MGGHAHVSVGGCMGCLTMGKGYLRVIPREHNMIP